MNPRRMLAVGVTGLLLVAAIGCEDNGPTGPGEALVFSSVYSAANSGIVTSRTEVIRDEQRWAAVWAEIHRGHGQAPPRPTFDFSREMAVLVGIGERPSGCYSVEILELSSGAGRIRVRAEERHTVGQCACTAATTQPLHVVRTPRTDGAPDPRIEARTVSCQ